MTKKFETVYGEITVSDAMFDMNGALLEEGIEIKGDYIDGIIELIGHTDVSSLSIRKVEELIDLNT